VQPPAKKSQQAFYKQLLTACHESRNFTEMALKEARKNPIFGTKQGIFGAKRAISDKPGIGPRVRISPKSARG
jgi:hypothetical protein